MIIKVTMFMNQLLSICCVQSSTSPSGLRSIQAGQLGLVSVGLDLTVGSKF